MKPVSWYVNVPLRTLKAFVPRLARPDDGFAERWLPPPEFALYRRMDPRDRDHACFVAREVLRLVPQAPATLVRAALLHDVGKSDAPYRAWERIAVHLCRPGGVPPAPGAGRLAGLWQRHHEHPVRGADMILAAGGDPDVAALVRHHHDRVGPKGADVLRRIDAGT